MVGGPSLLKTKLVFEREVFTWSLAAAVGCGPSVVAYFRILCYGAD